MTAVIVIGGLVAAFVGPWLHGMRHPRVVPTEVYADHIHGVYN